MARPKIIIADTDVNYVFSLQLKFVEEFFEKIDLEIITDKGYFEEQFFGVKKVEVLIVSEELYSADIQKHNIEHVFLMTEQYEEAQADDLNVTRIFKYTSIKEIFNKIFGMSIKSLNIESDRQNDPKIVLVYSAAGGVGKTTVALGICNSLTRNYKKVLYVNADRIQTFQHMMKNASPVISNEVYSKLAHADESIYGEIKHLIRKENFYYLPPFKAPLMLLGIEASVYGKIVKGARDSRDFDYIVIDADVVFDEEKAQLIDDADKVVIVTRQTEASVFATSVFVNNISESNTEKYVFICNDFDKDMQNSLIGQDIDINFTVNHYVKHFNYLEKLRMEDYSGMPDIQKTALLVM